MSVVEAWRQLQEFIDADAAGRRRTGKKREASGREAVLMSIGGKLRRGGADDDEIRKRLAGENYEGNPAHDNFTEHGPLAERDLERVIRSVLKYEPGDPGCNGELAAMNEEFTVLTQEGGKFRILSWRKSESGDYVEPVLQSKRDFLDAVEPRKATIKAFNKKTQELVELSVSVGPWWLRNPGRREYKALRFDPTQPAEFDGYLNLWRGFAFTPRPGDWSLMRTHIVSVLAADQKEYADYIIRWTAWSLQHPDELPEVALVFQGGEGIGKGAFGRTLVKLFGAHGRQIESSRPLTSRFNAILHNTCLLFVDENFWAGDKHAEAILRAMITEPTMNLERKGLDPITVRNRVHCVMAGNDDWAVPAAADARRYAVFRASEDRKGNKAYFDALAEEMDNGGYEAMLHDLLAMELGSWHPRQDVPQTEALEEQKRLSEDSTVWRELLEFVIDDAQERERNSFRSNWAGGIKIRPADARKAISNNVDRWGNTENVKLAKALRSLGFAPKHLRDGGHPTSFWALGGEPYRKLKVTRFDGNTVTGELEELKDAKVVPLPTRRRP